MLTVIDGRDRPRRRAGRAVIAVARLPPPVSASPKCPRCGSPVTGSPDDLGFLHCAGCGARLRKAPAVKVTVQSPTPSSAAPVTASSAAVKPPSSAQEDSDAILARLDAHEASQTLPPGSVAALRKEMAEKNAPGGAQLTDIVLQLQKDLRELRRSHEELAAFVDK